MKYAAFIRGINVGGNKKVPMSDLRAMCEGMGFTDVVTILASGNIVFESGQRDAELALQINNHMEKTFGFGAHVIVRTVKDLLALEKKDPFKSVVDSKVIKKCITFISDEPKGELTLPFVSHNGDLRILGSWNNMVFSVVDISGKTGSFDLNDPLESEYGKNITTRTWGTIEKILAV